MDRIRQIDLDRAFTVQEGVAGRGRVRRDNVRVKKVRAFMKRWATFIGMSVGGLGGWLLALVH